MIGTEWTTICSVFKVTVGECDCVRVVDYKFKSSWYIHTVQLKPVPKSPQCFVALHQNLS